jgi:hypothetical protein
MKRESELVMIDHHLSNGAVDLGRSSAKRYRAACVLVEEGFARWGEGALLLLARRRR